MTKISVKGLEFERLDNFMDEFQLVQVQKFLRIRGPLCLEVIDDQMYPDLRYGDYLKIISIKLDLISGLIVFWKEGKLCVGYIKGRKEDLYEVGFFNSACDPVMVERKYLLGKAILYKFSFIRKFKITLKLKVRESFLS